MKILEQGCDLFKGEIGGGMYIAAAYTKFIEWQNTILQPIIDANPLGGILYNYVDILKKKIPVQEASNEQIVLIDKRIDDLIEFSELGDFIDNPVRTYSSGMYMRLAFSVAINVDAEILLIDEILSVGDEHFQEKCFRKLEELKEQGKTIVFVTHGMGSVKRFCTRVVWLHQGKIKMDGNVDEVVDAYVEETR